MAKGLNPAYNELMANTNVSIINGLIYEPQFEGSRKLVFLRFRIGSAFYDFTKKTSTLEYFNAVCFGQTAEHLNKAIQEKGHNRISLMGELRAPLFKGKDGQKARSTQIIFKNFSSWYQDKYSAPTDGGGNQQQEEKQLVEMEIPF